MDAAVDAPAVDAGPGSSVDAAVVESHCGDGRIEGNEQCEYGVNAEGQTCLALALGTPPYSTSTDPVQCDALTCRWHAYNCKPDAVCGDGIVEGGESCDGDNLAGLRCENLLDRSGGTLACDAFCRLDTSACRGPNGEYCGNGIVELSEKCDGADVRGETCLDVGRLLGSVRCTAGCWYDYSDCHGGCTIGRFGPICY